MTPLLLYMLLATPVVHVEIPRQVMVEEPFDVTITVTREPAERLRTLAFGTIGRMVFKGEARLTKTEKLDTGKIREIYTLKARATVSDDVLDKRVARLERRIHRWESSDDDQLRKKVPAARKKLNNINKLYGFPSLPVMYVDSQGKDRKLETPSFDRDEFKVVSPLSGTQNPTLKEPLAKENLKSGGPRWRLFTVYQENVYLKYGLYGALGALLLALLVWWIRKKWKWRAKLEPPPPPRPPHEVAYEELARLGEMIPLRSEKEQEIFAFGLSEAIRRYFGARYGFDGLEMTVTEFMEEFRRHDTPGVLDTDVHEFLERLEYVKFAKVPLPDEEARDLLERAHVYVERTYVPEEDDEPMDDPRSMDTGEEVKDG